MYKYIIIILILLSGCSPAGSNNEIAPQPGEELCGQACDNLIKLHCDVISSCIAKCYADHKAGYFWNTPCLTNIATCDDVHNVCKSIFSE